MCRFNFCAKVVLSVLFLAVLGGFYFSFAKQDKNRIPTKVLFGSPEKSAPIISPDGTKLAYVAPNKQGIRNIWIRDLKLGKSKDYFITDQNERDIAWCIWLHDNEHVMYAQDNNGDENYHGYKVNIRTKEKTDLTPFEGVRAGFLAYRKEFPDKMFITMNKRDKKLFDVYELNLKTNTVKMVAENPGNISSWVVDHQNKVRGAIVQREDAGITGLIRDSETSEWRTLISWDFEDSNSSFTGFSKDGKFIYAKDSKDANTSRLVKIDTKTGAKQVIYEDKNYDFGSVVKDLDTKEILAGTIVRAKKDWVFFDAQFEKDFKTAAQLDTGEVSIIGRDNADKKWVLSFVKDDGPICYWIFDKEKKSGEYLFCSMPELKKYRLANMEPIFFESRDGLTIHGYLTCPIDKERKNLPMVLSVHGGPWHRDSWGYRPWVQWLVNRGFAVLQINFRGSTGYGKEFLNAGNRQWSLKMHDDLVDSVNWAIAQGVANPKKIGIFGGSYGGYAALVGATFTPDLFCCAVDIVGPSNLVTLLKTIPPYWSVGKHMWKKRVGDLETEKEFLESCSPLFKADKIKIPVMVVHGANDPRVKKAEAEQIVEAMKKNGIQYEYMLFEDEGHGFVKEVNKIKFAETAEVFLNKHMS